ncbi:hypothetical protein PRIPAC_95227 [Pristionchus pacificus]|uniref:Uncharacterized protein n=1 Tax=Pristionchus pacificus TaxID=54126 RepID=A0A2A6CH79_PRIPA|nr:hypothetical protein PRIPAC_95227 [Pristionchus pacificus]|eukprot:PDM77381.1 hypothetical protein PRIPAC_33111 [Pristionchus pacificus]
MTILGRFRSSVEYCGKRSDEWIHVTPRPIRLVGNDLLFKLDLTSGRAEDTRGTITEPMELIDEATTSAVVRYEEKGRWTEYDQGLGNEIYSEVVNYLDKAIKGTKVKTKAEA